MVHYHNHIIWPSVATSIISTLEHYNCIITALIQGDHLSDPKYPFLNDIFQELFHIQRKNVKSPWNSHNRSLMSDTIHKLITLKFLFLAWLSPQNSRLVFTTAATS